MEDAVEQALGSHLSAIAAHCAGNGLRPYSHLGLERLFERARQRFAGGCAGHMCAADAELIDSPGPVVLVVMLWDDHLGRAGARGRRGGARTPMVYDRGNPFE